MDCDVGIIANFYKCLFKNFEITHLCSRLYLTWIWAMVDDLISRRIYFEYAALKRCKRLFSHGYLSNKK